MTSPSRVSLVECSRQTRNSPVSCSTLRVSGRCGCRISCGDSGIQSDSRYYQLMTDGQHYELVVLIAIRRNRHTLTSGNIKLTAITLDVNCSRTLIFRAWHWLELESGSTSGHHSCAWLGCGCLSHSSLEKDSISPSKFTVFDGGALTGQHQVTGHHIFHIDCDFSVTPPKLLYR